MKFDSRWSAPIGKPFRILAGLLALIFIAMGALAIFTKFSISAFAFDSWFRSGLASLFYGVFFLVVAIRGKIL